MEEFHRQYKASRDPAAALRKAQLEMRRQRHPIATWAAFRYVGG
jgi:CHAT domain-containing protein